MANMYFIALVAPEEINRKVLKWKEYIKEHFGCEAALRSPAHVTIIPPFWMEETKENKLKDIISEFSKQQESFEISLKNFAAFKPRVIYVDVLPNEILNILHANFQQHLDNSGFAPAEAVERPYQPHVTIATRDLYKKAFHEAWEIFKEKEYKASWKTEGLSLLRHNKKNWDVIFTSRFRKN